MTSVGRMIDKIYRDLRPNSPNWEVDAVEWIGEALAHIGSGPQMEKKTAQLPIIQHRAVLPRDFVREEAVFLLAGGVPDGTPVSMNHMDPVQSPTFLPGHQFDIPDGYMYSGDEIHTSFPTGLIQFTYTAYATDSEGRPLVPDDPSYMDAFEWYIIKQMMIGGWRHANPQIDFRFASMEWQRYCSQARQKSKMPSLPEFDRFMRGWVKMVNLSDPRGAEGGSSGAIYGNRHIQL